ncbi:ATP-dependent DNA ligase [Microlunatus panaciterrae]|uniref:DNA ligase n=1 Tax=Microlunatus panaciterrae TaxID=400768 RepID=A0ABS2RKR2_9ACTN|nr:ATP-dependent DNA ligase [Microlunatus panaciterrae]MBM7799599.1 DNA ligase-1 [Microlunatus panaciterrae]
MLLVRIAETSAALAATPSRNVKRDLIAGVLSEATAEDIEIVISYLSGRLRQRRTGVGWRSLLDLPVAAAEATLTVAEADRAFELIADLSGAGSTRARVSAVVELFGRATDSEQMLLRGLVFEELRQGALDSLVQEGLALATDVPVAAVRRAAMLLGSTAAAGVVLRRGGVDALTAVGLTLGVPVLPMLAASAPDTGAAVDKSGLPVAVDFKLDGIRVQVHRDGDVVSIYTRSLEEITDRLPEVVSAVRSLAEPQLVLDGEVLAFRVDGRPEAFQVIASRTASQVDVAAQAARTPLSVFFFDLLRAGDRDLLDAPLAQRIEVMAEVLPPSMIVPRVLAEDEATVGSVFADAVSRGYEGVVIKNVTAGYAAGRRDAGWVKIKPRHTFDLVVTAAEWGHGRRTGLLSNLHLAARDPGTGELIMLGKTFKGLTDELLRWQTDRFLELETRRTAGTVHVRPQLVVEIACDGIQRSSRYPGGIALRFARVLRYRDDKSPSEADTIDQVRLLANTP